MTAKEEWIARIDRRQFMVQIGKAGAVVTLGAGLMQFLESCSNGNNPFAPTNVSSLQTIQVTPSNGVITLAVGAGSPLAAVGGAALLQYSNGAVLAAHSAQNTFNAVTAICTHQGCLITGYSGGDYVCPCHGSQFGTDGHVVQGPAGAPLQAYTTSFANGQLTIHL